MAADGVLAAVLKGWVEHDPAAPAIGDRQGVWLSRADLAARMAEGRQRLSQLGLQSSDRVAVLMPQGFEGAIVALQVASACTLAPLRPGLPPHQWPTLLRRLAPAALVLDPEIAPELARLALDLGVPLIDPGLLLNAGTVGQSRAPETDAEAAQAVVIATSGSTGLPKWVTLQQAALLQGCRSTASSLELTPADRALLALPLHHVHGLVSGLLMPLISGGSVVVAERFEAAEVLSSIQEQAISWISLPPAMHRALLDQQRHTPLEPGHRLRFLRSGAISLPQRLIGRLQQAFGVPLIEAYGMSECPHICGNPVQAPRAGSVGRPVVEHLAILGPEGRELPAGAWGEVAVRGAPLMLGYQQEGELLAPAAGEGWFRTGDQGRLDGDGYLYLRGRLSETINRGGQKVWPAVVDEAMLSHPDVQEAVAFALPHPTLGSDLVAAVVLRPGAVSRERDLRRHALAVLAGHEVPSRILLLEELPRGASGKVQRLAMAALLQGNLHPPEEPVSGELETLVAAVFAHVLGQSAPGRHANFFLLGGDSLSGTRAILRLAEELDLELEPTLLFLEPTIRGLAEHLKQRLKQAPTIGPRRAALPSAAVQPLPGSWPAGCAAFLASHAQSRLWFLQQLEPHLTAYHLPILWRLQGALDRAALEQALTALIERHPTLRTSFALRGQDVIQILHPPDSFPIPVERLEGRDPDRVMAEWMEQEDNTPFDLRSGRLLRVRLLSIDDEEHRLLLNLHHIAADGWSLSILSRDLVAFYNAARTGGPANLRPLKIHYHDHAAWQHQRLRGGKQSELNSYWSSQLSGVEPLELPTDHPRPARPSYRGGSVCFTIEPALLQPFESLCRGEGATLQMGLLAVVAVLLQRYSRQEDFAIGVPVWGRNHPELEPLIGLFVNTLPIRTHISPDLSFRELLAQIRDTSIGAYAHQALPFEQMVEALHVERDSSRNPLFQVVLQLVELPPACLSQLHGLQVERLSHGTATSRFDLEFLLRRAADGGLHATLTYATDIFSADRMERLAAHLITLLASVAAAPDEQAVTLNLLPEVERQRIESWQEGPGIAVPELRVPEVFEWQVQRSPDAIALVFQDQTITYGELNSRASRLAHDLIGLGVGPEVIVAVCLQRSIEMVVALLAILKAGGAYLPLDPAWPPERRQLLLREAGCCVLIDGEEPVLLDSPPPPSPREAASASSLAYVSYTSGSTGTPKGVAITHASILRLVDAANGFCVSPGDRVLQLAPLAFDAVTFEIWGPLLNGGTLVIAPPGQLSLQELAAILQEQRITTLWLTAGLFHAMVESERNALAGVRQVLAGGDVLAPEPVTRLLKAFPPGHGLINGYGPTENTTFTCCHRLEAGATLSSASVPIGRPIAATCVRVLDASGELCPIGIPGELHIGGAGLARGYLNHPELTTEKFIPDPLSTDPSARLYRSGDLVSWNPDGTLAFHGRLDQQIKLRGFRIEPGEIEANLLAHPAVAQAAVVLRQDTAASPRLVAYWVASEGPGTGTAADRAELLRRFLSERLPDFMVPAAFLQLAALPLTRNGKLDRRALPAPNVQGDQEQRIEPGSETEHRLHGLWAEVLGHDDFGVTDNFFLAGGHSLSSARLSALIEQQLGRRVPLSVLFQRPTLRELSLWLESADTAVADTPVSLSGFRSLVTLQHRGKAPALFVVHGGHGDVYIHLPLARCLSPHRPVYGLQAVGFDGSAPRQRSVVEMAAHYADEILRFQPSGPYHLLGYSGGGWYAWAVAAELHRRGATVGLIGLVDTGATADLHRRLRLRQLIRRQMQLLPCRARSLTATDFSRWPGALNRKREALQFITWTLLRPQGTPAPLALNPTAGPRPTQPLRGDYFLQLHTYFRPQRLPLRADVFAARSRIATLRKLWNFYTQGRVVLHPCLEDHGDYYNTDWVSDFAVDLESVLAGMEAAGPPQRVHHV
jgi:amino acid adenylation domain-containing protein